VNLKSLERDDKNLVTLTIEMDAVEFEEAVARACKRDAGRLNVPGFRRGKAPRKMIETVYGASVFYESAVNLSYPEAYDKAIEENGLEPVEEADIEVTSVGPEGYAFIARVHVYPEAEVGAYKGLHAFKPPVSVEEADVDAELSRLRDRNARLVTVQRPAQNDDTVTIDFEGYIDDIPFEGGKGDNYPLVLGSGRFIPGFEEQLVGHAAGEECKVAVTFPEEYAPELAGRNAVFAVKIHEVKENEKPALDDEFAKDVSEFDTLIELRDSIRERLKKQRAESADEAFEDALNDQIIAGTQVEVPETMVHEQESSLLQNMVSNLSARGLELASYLQITGQTADEFRASAHERAHKLLTAQLAFEKIAALEGLEVSDEALEAEYAKVAEQYQKPLEQVKAAIPARSLRRDLLRLQASELVKSSAFADDKPPVTFEAKTGDTAEPAAAPTPKPAAKKAAAPKPKTAKPRKPATKTEE
jgi:trigger factor